jgi:hypothetical protein
MFAWVAALPLWAWVAIVILAIFGVLGFAFCIAAFRLQKGIEQERPGASLE